MVIYATAATVARLSGDPGYDRARAPAARHESDGRRRNGRSGAPLPPHRARVRGLREPAKDPRAGRVAGQGRTEQFAKLLGVITLLALLSALVLISNTMTTLVAEQTAEIGAMRAVGARAAADRDGLR